MSRAPNARAVEVISSSSDDDDDDGDEMDLSWIDDLAYAYPTPPPAFRQLSDADAHTMVTIDSKGKELNFQARFCCVTAGTTIKQMTSVQTEARDDELAVSLFQIKDLYFDAKKQGYFDAGHAHESRTALLYRDMVFARCGRELNPTHADGFYKHFCIPMFGGTIDCLCQDVRDGLLEQYIVECKFAAGKRRHEDVRLHNKTDCYLDKAECAVVRQSLEDALAKKPSATAVCRPRYVTTKAPECPCPIPEYRIDQLMFQSFTSGYEEFHLAQSSERSSAFLTSRAERHHLWLRETMPHYKGVFRLTAWYWLDDATKRGAARKALDRLDAKRRAEYDTRKKEKKTNIPISPLEIDRASLFARRPSEDDVRMCRALARTHFEGKKYGQRNLDFLDIDPLCVALILAMQIVDDAADAIIAQIASFDVGHPSAVFYRPPWPADTATAQLRILPSFVWNVRPPLLYFLTVYVSVGWRVYRYDTREPSIAVSRRAVAARSVAEYSKEVRPDARNFCFLASCASNVREVPLAADDIAAGFRVQPSGHTWTADKHLRVIRVAVMIGLSDIRHDADAVYGGFVWGDGRYRAFYCGVSRHGGNEAVVDHRFDEIHTDIKRERLSENMLNLQIPGCRPPEPGAAYFYVGTCGAPPKQMAMLLRAIKIVAVRVVHVYPPSVVAAEIAVGKKHPRQSFVESEATASASASASAAVTPQAKRAKISEKNTFEH